MVPPSLNQGMAVSSPSNPTPANQDVGLKINRSPSPAAGNPLRQRGPSNPSTPQDLRGSSSHDGLKGNNSNQNPAPGAAVQQHQSLPLNYSQPHSQPLNGSQQNNYVPSPAPVSGAPSIMLDISPSSPMEPEREARLLRGVTSINLPVCQTPTELKHYAATDIQKGKSFTLVHFQP